MPVLLALNKLDFVFTAIVLAMLLITSLVALTKASALRFEIVCFVKLQVFFNYNPKMVTKMVMIAKASFNIFTNGSIPSGSSPLL